MASIVNTTILMIVYPGDLPIGPIYNLTAVMSMLLGIYIIQRFIAEYFSRSQESKLIAFSTLLGSITRVAIMSIVNLVFMRYPYPIGFSMPIEALIATLPAIAIFNATVVLYTVPLGYFVSRAVSYGTSTKRWGQL